MWYTNDVELAKEDIDVKECLVSWLRQMYEGTGVKIAIADTYVSIIEENGESFNIDVDNL